MPYITQDQRKILDPIVDQFASRAEYIAFTHGDRSRDGVFNYVVTKLALRLFDKRGYSQFVRVAGGLEEIKAEYRRRIVAPYEDGKASKNGDVYDLE